MLFMQGVADEVSSVSGEQEEGFLDLSYFKLGEDD
jgi:hypothetical protein